MLDSRDPDLPVGLRVGLLLDKRNLTSLSIQNLGATCYANASLQVRLKMHTFPSVRQLIPCQVWYRDLAFREGVYRCQPPHGTEDRFKVG